MTAEERKEMLAEMALELRIEQNDEVLTLAADAYTAETGKGEMICEAVYCTCADEDEEVLAFFEFARGQFDLSDYPGFVQ